MEDLSPVSIRYEPSVEVRSEADNIIVIEALLEVTQDVTYGL